MQTHDKKMPDYNQVAQNDESAQFGFPEDWDSVQLDHLGNITEADSDTPAKTRFARCTWHYAYCTW